MSFLTCTPDLSKTIFTDNDLRLARQHLLSLITREDAAWLKKPQGVLGEYWKSDEIYPICVLIETAHMIHTLEARIAQKSVPRLYEKVRELLRPPSPEQFLEKQNELQIAHVLVHFVCPLAFLTSEDILEPKVSRCPDFGFQTPDGIAFVEVTVFHGGILATWSQATQRIKNALHLYLFKHNRMLNVHIALPLKAEMESQQIIEAVVQELATRETGAVLIGKKGVVQWEPLRIISIPDAFSSPPEISSPGSAFHTPGIIIDRAFTSQSHIAFATEEDARQARELVLRSLRTKLREKRGQFPGEPSETCLIVMRLEHHLLSAGDIEALLQERIWPNETEHDWLSGLVIFTPRSGFLPSDKENDLRLCPNPRSFRPVSASVMALFNGTAQYHM